MNVQSVDLNTWERGKLFQFYIQRMRVVMSLTVDVDVTPLVNYAKQNGLRFYPCMIWVVSKVVNSHDNFKYSWDPEGNLIRWESISPSYAVFDKNDEQCTKLVTPFCENLLEFHARFVRDQEKYKDVRGIVDHQPPNFFDVSCLPWVHYRHFDVHVFDEGTFLAPVVTWGKYELQQGRLKMPLTMNIHHAVADGFHLSRFFTEVQEQIDALIED